MKRTFAILALLALSLVVQAIGPKVPHYLYWLPPNDTITGYWFYWRTTNGVYADSNRLAVGLNAQGFDVSVAGMPQGVYYATMTSTNAAGAESIPADEVLWIYQNPGKPTGVVLKP